MGFVGIVSGGACLGHRARGLQRGWRGLELFPHEHARARTYRWSEDGIGGICDHKQRLCFAFAFWNERDPILKERFFGLSGPQGNHGEDVKEIYFYTDNTPSHSFMQMVYRYPQAAFPYERLIAANRARSKQDPEFELWDTDALDPGFFDIEIEYAKHEPDDIFIRATATNHGPNSAALHVLPTLWFRNTWPLGTRSAAAEFARRPERRWRSCRDRSEP